MPAPEIAIKFITQFQIGLMMCYTAKWIEGQCRVRSLPMDGDPRRDSPEPRAGHLRPRLRLGRNEPEAPPRGTASVVTYARGVSNPKSFPQRVPRRGFGELPWLGPRSAAYPGPRLCDSYRPTRKVTRCPERLRSLWPPRFNPKSYTPRPAGRAQLENLCAELSAGAESQPEKLHAASRRARSTRKLACCPQRRR